MKIQKTELATKLNQIKGVVPKKTTMPILQGILVKEGYLIANNLEMTVKAKLEGTEMCIRDRHTAFTFGVCRICVYSKYDYKSFDGACTVP